MRTLVVAVLLGIAGAFTVNDCAIESFHAMLALVDQYRRDKALFAGQDRDEVPADGPVTEA